MKTLLALLLLNAAVVSTVAACDAFRTTDIPCPKRCSTGGCCNFDEECRPDGCRYVGDPLFGASRDAGADR